MKKYFAIPALILLMLTTFTNCSPYSQVDNSSLDALANLSCPSSSNKCVTPTFENLSITVNLPLNSNQISLQAASDFNLGGDCNEGGYPANQIIWELYDGTTKVRDSQALGYNSQCVNGRFMLYFTLGSVTADPVNRTGGVDGAGNRKNYALVYRLRAFGPTGAVDAPTATKSISLLPRQI